uniref:Endo/exonuclease/phosphatase domain-containing protein n=1 Tax=Schistocephalus solidus TaxID=70667 RepID=A0A183SGT9_SCHSO
LVPNSHLWLLEFGFFPATTPRETVTTGGLNQVRVSGAVCASTPVARELARYKLDIAVLSETRFSEQEQLKEVGAGYTSSWSGRPKAERHDAGVTFTTRNVILGRLPCLPQGINYHLMSLSLPLRGDQFTTIISTYAPPMTSSDAVKDKFYEDLHALLVTVPKADKLIVLGDFKTRVGTGHAAWQGVLGPHGFDHVDAPSVAALAAAGNVLIRRRDRQDVMVTKAIRDDNGWTDHRLVLSQMRLRLQRQRRPQYNPETGGRVCSTVETRWCQLRNVIQSTALKVLGRARHQHQDWFDDNGANISNLLAEKNQIHKAYMDFRSDATKTAFFSCCRLVKQWLREIQDVCMVRKAREIQGCVDAMK